VTVADIRADGVNETAELIRNAGGEATPVVADMTRPADITAMVEAATSFICAAPRPFVATHDRVP
jgi:hypothetical protein